MIPVTITKSLATASANNIAQSQSVAAGASFILNGSKASGGVATLDTQRRVIIVSGGNDSATKATIKGTSQAGSYRTEVLALTNGGTAVSNLDYLTVTSVTPSAATATTATIGTNGTGSTDWIMPNFHLTPFNVDIDTQLSGSVTYNVETTQDNYWAAGTGGVVANTVNVFAVSSGATVAVQDTLTAAITGFRYTITANTGTLTAQATQAGIVNY